MVERAAAGGSAQAPFVEFPIAPVAVTVAPIVTSNGAAMAGEASAIKAGRTHTAAFSLIDRLLCRGKVAGGQRKDRLWRCCGIAPSRFSQECENAARSIASHSNENAKMCKGCGLTLEAYSRCAGGAAGGVADGGGGSSVRH